MSLGVTVKGQGHQGQKRAVHSHHPSPPALPAMEWNALSANNIIHQPTGPFHHYRGVISAGCVWFMFGETSLALVNNFFQML